MAKFFRFMALAAVLLVSGSIYAQSNWQDVVYCKNGSVIKGVITEQIPNKTVKIQTADGNVFVYDMNDIEKISKEQLQTSNSTSAIGVSNNSNELCFQGKSDAQSYYKGNGSLSGVTWAVNLITSPLFGLIPAAIGASSDLNDSQMNYPDRELWKDSDYRSCYTDEAMRKKSKKSWSAYGISAGVWAGVIILLNVVAGSM